VTPEFIRLSPADLGDLVRRKNIIDARNALSPAACLDAGWNYRALGIGAGSPVMPR
jgi:UDPglucose 6-dehydrogenase